MREMMKWGRVGGGWVGAQLKAAEVTVAFFSSAAQLPKSGLGHLTVEVSTSHTIRHTHRPGRTPPNK